MISLYENIDTVHEFYFDGTCWKPVKGVLYSCLLHCKHRFTKSVFRVTWSNINYCLFVNSLNTFLEQYTVPILFRKYIPISEGRIILNFGGLHSHSTVYVDHIKSLIGFIGSRDIYLELLFYLFDYIIVHMHPSCHFDIDKVDLNILSSV
jgi:hypothetical protein